MVVTPLTEWRLRKPEFTGKNHSSNFFFSFNDTVCVPTPHEGANQTHKHHEKQNHSTLH